MKPEETTPLVIFGTGDLALVLSRHLRAEQPGRRIVFTVDRERLTTGPTLDGLEVVAFEDLEDGFPPDRCEMLVAIGYHRVNRSRAEVFERCRRKGYRLTRYVGAGVNHCEPLEMGENCLIFPGTTLHPFVGIGDNVIIWGQCHVGHHTVIEDHAFLASAGVSGRCRVGTRSFLGAGSWVGDHVSIGEGNVIGAGAVITRDTGDGEVYRPDRQRRSPIPSDRLWR